MRLVAVRGATTCESDSPEEISLRTKELLQEIIDVNDLRDEDLVSIIFTATDDLTSAFPASAAREMGLTDVPLLGTRELAVAGAVERCIRVLVHCYSPRERGEIRHVYLEGAKSLRADLD